MSVAQGGLLTPVVFVARAYMGLDGIIWSMTITEVATCVIGTTPNMLSKDKFGTPTTAEQRK